MAVNSEADSADTTEDGDDRSAATVIVERLTSSSVETVTGAIESGILDHSDLERFCRQAETGVHDPPPGVVDVVRVLCTLCDRDSDSHTSTRE